MSTPIVDVTGRVARLYQEDPRGFVTERNALARDLARAGQRELSSRIKTLAKPSVAAWVVNQLFWHDRAEYDALLAAGHAARDAQQARLSGRGGDLARALAERDAIVDRMSRQAERLAAAGGVAVSTDVRSRVRTSLEAIALRAGDPALAHGQLAEEVALPGLQALAGLIPSTSGLPPPRPARVALSLVPAAETIDNDADARARALARELDEVRAAIETGRSALASARERADEEAGASTAADQQVTAAVRSLEAAQERVTRARAVAEAAAARAATAAGEAERLDAEVESLLARERELLGHREEPAATPARRGTAPQSKTRRVSRKR